MTRERLEQLLWLRLDGALEAEEQRELEAALATEPEAARLERELSDLGARLTAIPRVAPPAELRPRIDRALATARPGGRAGVTAPFAHRRPAGEWRARLLPLAAGLVIGAAIVQLLHLEAGRGVSGSTAAGTMRPTRVERGVPALVVDLGGEVGSVTVATAGATLTLELRLADAAGAQVALQAPAGELRLLAASHSEGAAGSVTADGGKVVLEAKGPGTYRLSVGVPEGGNRLRLEATSAAGTTVERWVEVGPGEGRR